MKKKRWSEMTTHELAAATKAFDKPGFQPRSLKPTNAERAALQRVRAASEANRSRVALSLDTALVEATDDYAGQKGMTFSEVVADALLRLVKKRSA